MLMHASYRRLNHQTPQCDSSSPQHRASIQCVPYVQISVWSSYLFYIVRGRVGQNERKTYFLFVFNTCTRYYVKYLHTYYKDRKWSCQSVSKENVWPSNVLWKICWIYVVMLYVVNMLMKKYFNHLCVRIIMITKTRTILLYKQIIEQII